MVSTRRGKEGEGKGEERSWAAAGAWAAAEKGFAAWASLLAARERERGEGLGVFRPNRESRGTGLWPTKQRGKFFLFPLFVFFFYFQTIFKSV